MLRFLRWSSPVLVPLLWSWEGPYFFCLWFRGNPLPWWTLPALATWLVILVVLPVLLAEINWAYYRKKKVDLFY